MVVWRFHGTKPPAEHMEHMHAKLREIATALIGNIYIDDNMRNIPDHYHAHARPKGGFFGYGIRRPDQRSRGERPSSAQPDHVRSLDYAP